MGNLQPAVYVPVGVITHHDDPQIRVNRANQRSTSRSYPATPTTPANTLTLRTITGIARLQATTTRTTTGLSRMQQRVSQTVAGLSRLQQRVSQTTTGLSRLEQRVLQTMAGLSRLQQTVLQTIQGLSSITSPAPPTVDCPTPGPAQNIALTTTDFLSSDQDTALNQIWVANEFTADIAWVDVISGTLGGTISISPYGSFGIADIIYDPANKQMAALTYDGDFVFIDTVSKSVTGAIPGLLINYLVNPRCIATDSNGTLFVSQFRNEYGALHMVDGAAKIQVAGAEYLPDLITSDGICYANNIGKVVLGQSAPNGPLFYLYDTTSGAFTPSVLTGPESFRYETHYLPTSGYVIQSRDGGGPSYVLDIANGASATVVGTLTAATRLNAVCENTCCGGVLVHNGNDTAFEYLIDGTYNLQINDFAVTPAGFEFSRKTNLAYYQDFNTTPTRVKTIETNCLAIP